jgi:cytochrome c-type biogenesis protein CcmF
VLPVIALWVAVIGCLIAGVRPWHDGALDQGHFYALVAFGLAAGVLTAIGSEFLRGAMVIANRAGEIFLVEVSADSAQHAALRRLHGPHRRGDCGDRPCRLGLQSQRGEGTGAARQLAIGSYTLECVGPRRTRTPTTPPTTRCSMFGRAARCSSRWRRRSGFIWLSGQPQTMVAIHSVVAWDLYVVYEGANPETGQPIIKAFLNPLVSWIWAGALLMILGTLTALTPKQLSVVSDQLSVPAAKEVGKP